MSSGEDGLRVGRRHLPKVGSYQAQLQPGHEDSPGRPLARVRDHGQKQSGRCLYLCIFERPRNRGEGHSQLLAAR